MWLDWLILWLSDSPSQARCAGKTLLFQAFRSKWWRPFFFFFCLFFFCYSFSHLLTSPAPCLGGPRWKSPFSRMCCSWQPVPNRHLAERWQSDWRSKYSGRFFFPSSTYSSWLKHSVQIYLSMANSRKISSSLDCMFIRVYFVVRTYLTNHKK